MPFEFQGPTEERTYSVEWADWLADGDTLASVSWTLTPAVTSEPTTLNFSGTVASCRLGGLTAGKLYNLLGKMTSNSGEKGEQAITIRCGVK